MVTWQFPSQSHLMHALTLGTKQTERIHLLPRKGPALIHPWKNLLLLPVSIERTMSASFNHWKAVKAQILTFQTFPFFFLPEIALTSKRMKNACVQVAAGKASRRRSLPRNGAGDEFEQRNRSKEVMIIRNIGATSIPTGIRALMFWEWYEFTGGIISTLAHLHLSAKDII